MSLAITLLASVVDTSTEVVTTGGDDLGREWTDTTIALPEAWWPLLGTAIPPLTALIARYRQPGQRLAYGLLSIALAIVVAVIGALVDQVPDTVGGVATTASMALVASVISYLLVWSNAGRGPGNGINETLRRGGVV